MRRYSVQKKLNWTQSPWRQCAFNDKFTMDGDEPIIALLGGLQSGLPQMVATGGLDLRQAYLKLKRPSKCCFAYNLSTLQWRRIANLKLGRVFHMLVAHEGIIYAIGGQGNDDALLGSVECYDPEQDWWHVIQGHLCCPRMAAAAAVTKQGSVVIAGGATRADRASKKVYLTSDVCMLHLPDLT
ncbi:kelch-like protein 42 [Ixodes scapularis]|uniref:kelch-like protein 42 n=1 Tax=Ixodes scapularis TaxID=6945 RepID=UPI001A9D666B|nr:kelch-like protein 42 [Ixodes scapularis]